MGKEWISLKETGQLCVEKVLVTFDTPTLFVCTDSSDKRYLCLNIGENDDKYVIAKTNARYLLNMLRNKYTMEFVFRNSIDGKIILAEYDYDGETIVSESKTAQDVRADLLPKKGEYFELSNDSIVEYIKRLDKDVTQNCLKEVYTITAQFKTLPYGIVTEDMLHYSVFPRKKDKKPKVKAVSINQNMFNYAQYSPGIFKHVEIEKDKCAEDSEYEVIKRKVYV